MSNIQPLPGGYAHLNYRVRYEPEDSEPLQCVLRVPHGKLSERQRRSFCWELDYLQTLVTQGAPVCEVIGADVLNGVLLTRWYEGQHLHQVSPARIASSMQRLERSLALLPAQTRRYDPLAELRELDAVPSWIRSLASSCGSWLNSQGAMVQPCHNDLNPFNLLCSMAGAPSLVILDWEMAGLNHPGFDLVTAGLGLARERAVDYQTTLVALQQRLGQETADWLVRCYWLREWAWAMRQLATGNRLDAVQEQESLARSQLQALTLR